ncbi:MAG: hypothetical protein AAGF24_01005, partial [Cyanobacteria bacterium P01_H01_bin.121]
MTIIIALHSVSHGAEQSSLCASLSLDFAQRGNRAAILSPIPPQGSQTSAAQTLTIANLLELAPHNPNATLHDYVEKRCQLA